MKKFAIVLGIAFALIVGVFVGMTVKDHIETANRNAAYAEAISDWNLNRGWWDEEKDVEVVSSVDDILELGWINYTYEEDGTVYTSCAPLAEVAYYAYQL